MQQPPRLGQLGAYATALAVASLAPAQTQLFAVAGDDFGDAVGSAVAFAGDVDGDGHDDVVVGAPGDRDAGGIATGAAIVCSGATGAVLFRWLGAAANDAFGRSVAGAGDVDGDGRADVVVGAGNQTDAPGYVRVYSGATGALRWQWTSSAEGFGASVAGAGDLDADGYDDVAVGEPFADAQSVGVPGRMLVYSGRTGAVLLERAGLMVGDMYGTVVAGGGDANGDGCADVLVGAPTFFPPSPGYVQVWSGADGALLRHFATGAVGDGFGRSAAFCGDVDGDSRDDVVVGAQSASPGATQGGGAFVYSGGTGALRHTFVGTTVFGFLGKSVGGVGDVDGDGRDDVVLGQPGDFLYMGPGYAYVLSGASGALLSALEGAVANERFGASVGGGGDADGDGLADVVIGAPTWVAGQGVGSAVVFDAGYAGTPSRERVRGAACPLGLDHLPRAGHRGRARVGGVLRVTLRGGPTTGSASLLVGPSTALPLSPIGLTGCTLLVNPWGTVPLSIAARRAALDLSFPNDANMIGFRFGCQWLVPDPAAPFALPLTASDALAVTVGGP